jgi:predicted DCC family thiol-disulfide oxidoreductase YuxK
MSAPYSYRDDPAVPTFDDSATVAVIDAECAVCSWGARMIHRLDRQGSTRICPIQTPLGAALLRHYGLDPNAPPAGFSLTKAGPTRISRPCFTPGAASAASAA